MDEINEKTTGYLTVTFKDSSGSAAQPTSASYKIIDIDSGETVRDTTALTVSAGVVTITLDKDDNTLLDANNDEERRRVVVSAVYNADDELHGVYWYKVKNLPSL